MLFYPSPYSDGLYQRLMYGGLISKVRERTDKVQSKRSTTIELVSSLFCDGTDTNYRVRSGPEPATHNLSSHDYETVAKIQFEIFSEIRGAVFYIGKNNCALW